MLRASGCNGWIATSSAPTAPRSSPSVATSPNAQEAERKLAESEALFRDLADKSADVVWRFMLEPTPHFDYISPSVENILGYPPSYFLEDFTRMLDILDDAGRTAVERGLHGDQALGRFDFRFRHANGSIVVGETRTTSISGGLQGVSRDVTELRQLQDDMAALALRDPLTGLANRRLFDELLDADLARTQRSGAAAGDRFPRPRRLQERQRHARPRSPATWCCARQPAG